MPLGQKRPVVPDWPSLRLTGDDLADRFSAPTNIGIILGEPSGWLVDIDLDCAEAVELADEFLPPTAAVSGRSSRPRSHRWYICRGATTVQHRDPTTGDMIVELRSTGAQTVVGPSLHPDGERYDTLEGEPAVVPAGLLNAAVRALADAVVERRGHGPTGPLHSPQCTAPAPHPVDETERRAAAYLDAMPAAISGQGGHSRTYAAATALVHGFGLSQDLALRFLIERYNPRCEPPWTEKELRHKVEDAATKPHDRPWGWLLHRPLDGRAEACLSTPGSEDELLGSVDPATGRLVLSPRRTLPTAQAFVRAFCTHADGRTLHNHAGMLLEWRENRYRQIEDESVRHRLQPWLHVALRPAGRSESGASLADFESNPATVGAALDSIRSLVHLSGSISPPSWLGDTHDRPPACEVLACRGVNLHIPTGTMFPPTPLLFTMNALEFDCDSAAPPPERWLLFLDQLWGDDLESIELLQEWMGYSLVPDTSQQKMLLIVGPKRSGKGTIGRVLTQLVGPGNVAGPTTTGLAGPFGLQPLLDKSLAIVSDARFAGESVATVAERLLCISGEDSLTVDRKYLPAVSVKLPTRFVFMSNELPRFGDASGALPGRFLVLRLANSFYGREDPTLTMQLFAELPGILNWALEGWRRLRSRGRFVQPSSAGECVRDLEDLASPMIAFLREKCDIRAGARVEVDTLFDVWSGWCAREAIRSGDKQSFGRDLQAAAPGVRRRRGTGNIAFYDGVALCPGGEP